MIHISGGHATNKAGASHKGFSEFPETRLWAVQITEALRVLGVWSHLVSEGRLVDKVKEINSMAPLLAVEVHFNADPTSRGKGSETLYCPGSWKGRQLADSIQRSLGTFFPPNRGIKEGWYKMDRPGAVDYRGDVDGDETIDYFLEATHCPAVIVEPEFIHNHHVFTDMREIGCQVIAEAIAEVAEEWR